MRRSCVRIGFLTTAAILLTASASARADVAKALFRGLEQAGNFSFLSEPRNGPFNDNNQFNHRVEYNRAGGGYTYEQWRFFGQDSYGNPTSLDLGPLKFELGSNSDVLTSDQAVGVHTRVGYTTTLLPEVFFSQQTGQRFQNQFAGESGARAAPLHYNISLNTGVQDLEWDGNVLIDTEGRLNALGFYDFRMNVLNEGTFTANGALVTDEKNLDFEIGPIDVSGNVLMDGIAGLTQMLGGTNEALPFRVASGGAQKDKPLDELLTQIRAGETLSDADTQLLAKYALTSSVMNDHATIELIDRTLSEVGEGLDIQVSAGDPADMPGAVPEPGTLVLVLVAAMSLIVIRTSRRPEVCGHSGNR